MQMVHPLADFAWTSPISDALAFVAIATFLLLAGSLVLKLLAMVRNSASYHAQVEAIHRSHMTIELGMDGTILKVNSNYACFIGYTAEEMEGQQLSKVVTGEDIRSGAYDAFWEELRAGRHQNGQYERVTKGGQHIWIQAIYSPILDAQGAPVKIVGLVSDVTERLRMEREREQQEEALLKSEQFLTEIASMAEAGGWEVDLATGVVTWMPETYKLMGADPSYRPTVENGLSRYTEESKPVITAAVERAKADGTGWDLTLSLLRIDGQLIWARVVGRARFVDGKPACLFGIFQDISRRMEESAILRWANERAELATSSGGIGIWDWNIEKNTLVCDAQMYRLIHATPEEKETNFNFWFEFVHPADRLRVEQALQNAIHTGKPYEAEYRILLEDGLHFIRSTGQVSCDGKLRPNRMVGTMVDITARVAEKMALEDANERTSLATESGGCGIWEWDIVNDRMIFDQRTMRLYDLEEDEQQPVTYQTWVQFMHTEDRAATEQAARESLDGKRPFDAEFRIVLEDGKVRYIRTTGKVIRDENGRPTRMLGTNFEITAHKQAEEALREQASLLDLCHDAIIVRDLEGTILFWNQGAEEIYEFSKDNALGETSHQLLRTTFPAPLAEIERIFLERGRWEGELKHRSRSGRHVLVDSRWALKRDKNGRGIGVMEINSDITERRQAEDALLRSAEQEQLLIDGVKDYSIIMLDPQGNVTTWNEGAKQIKGYKAEEILGRHISMFYPEELNAAGKPKLVLEVARQEGRSEETGWRVRKGGGLFWANVVLTALFDAEGQLRGYCKITRDITEYKLAEEATENARVAADQASRAKSDFLANMSHEVRTPVNAIMGMAHLALRADPQPRQREYLVKIDTAAKRLLGIMNDILDFSKIEAGKLKLEHIEFALSEVIQNLRDVVEHGAREKKLALVFSVAADVPAYLSGDPLRLGQVLINLVNNAVKFTEQGEVRVAVQQLSEEEDSLCLRFSIADTGIGMTALQMENLFQAFHQADTSFTRQYGGTGLGLAISKQLVEMMGGSIGIESDFGIGSKFTFTVKMGRADHAASMPLTDSPVPLNASRILVVDDSENIRGELVQLLRHHGQLAYGTGSGEEALSILVAGMQRGNPFHLVVMDWRLPGMNGMEVSRRIRHEVELQPTPIIIMISAFDRHDIAPTSELAHFDKFLLKPLQEESFLNAVWSSLHGEGNIQASSALNQPLDTGILAGRNVLLVEDNDLNRDLATELLEDLLIRVTVAADGQAAVDTVRSQPFDLVLMDIQMPVMDGLTATRAIRSERRFQELPIVAMTAHAMTGDYERSLAAGMNDHINKPIDPRVLEATLLRWMPVGPLLTPPRPQGAFPDHIPPFNIAAALLRTNKKPLLLRKLLLGFKQQYAHAVSELGAFLLQEQWAEAQRLVHSLRSIAGMLEARTLADASGAIEDALRSGRRTGLEALIDDLAAALQPAIAAVASMDQTAALLSS